MGPEKEFPWTETECRNGALNGLYMARLKHRNVLGRACFGDTNKVAGQLSMDRFGFRNGSAPFFILG